MPRSRDWRRFLKKECIFTIWLIWQRPRTRTAGHEIQYPGVENKILKEIHQFYIKHLLSLWETWNLQFLISLPNLVKLTDDARPTTDNDRCQPIAIGHLSESGDLKCDQDCVAITKTQIKTRHSNWISYIHRNLCLLVCTPNRLEKSR